MILGVLLTPNIVVFSESDMKAISITLFCTSVGMVGLGITLAFVWCRYTGYSTQKNEDSEDAEDPKPTSNGHTTNASPDAARKDQDAGETSEGQKKKKEKKEKEKNKRESAYTNAVSSCSIMYAYIIASKHETLTQC